MVQPENPKNSPDVAMVCPLCKGNNIKKLSVPFEDLFSPITYKCKTCGKDFKQYIWERFSEEDIDHFLKDYIFKIYNQAMKTKDKTFKNVVFQSLKQKVLEAGKKEKDYTEIYKPLLSGLFEEGDFEDKPPETKDTLSSLKTEKEILDKSKKEILDMVSELNLDSSQCIQLFKKFIDFIEQFHLRAELCLKEKKEGLNYNALLKLDRLLMDKIFDINAIKVGPYDLMLPHIKNFISFFNIYRENVLILLGDSGYKIEDFLGQSEEK